MLFGEAVDFLSSNDSFQPLLNESHNSEKFFFFWHKELCVLVIARQTGGVNFVNCYSSDGRFFINIQSSQKELQDRLTFLANCQIDKPWRNIGENKFVINKELVVVNNATTYEDRYILEYTFSYHRIRKFPSHIRKKMGWNI